MSQLNLTRHISQQYNTELEALRRQLLAMGGLVEEQLAAALHAVAIRSSAQAAEISAREAQVDALEIGIDEQCTSILARRQPAASDLRLVLSVLKMTADIERIGDEAEHVANLAETAQSHDFDEPLLLKFDRLGQMVRELLLGALDAFARMDVALAVDIIRRDRKVDAAYDDLLRGLIATMSVAPERFPALLEMIWSAKALERIGDRAKNLCEHAIYMVRGQDVRHTRIEDEEKAPD